MVLSISCLSLNNSRGYFLLKWVDWKDGLFYWFFDKNPVETYRGIQGSKIDPVNLGEWVQTALGGYRIYVCNDINNKKMLWGILLELFTASTTGKFSRFNHPSLKSNWKWPSYTLFHQRRSIYSTLLTPTPLLYVCIPIWIINADVTNIQST